MNGIDKSIVERADDLCLLSARGEDMIAACATMSASEELDLKIAVSDSLAAKFLVLSWNPTQEPQEDTARSFLLHNIERKSLTQDGQDDSIDPRALLKEFL